MSDTDDTDELLLIPPDFFINQQDRHYSDDLGPYYHVVDSLITQVDHLENRINSIQSSNSDLASSMQEIRSKSTQNTPQKPRNKFTVASLPNSPHQNNVEKSYSMLGEIDSFISNVKLIKRLNAVRHLEGDFNDAIVQPKSNLKQVDEILLDLDCQNKKMEARIREKEAEIFKTKVWQAGDYIDSVPDLGCGMRNNMCPKQTQSSSIDTDNVDTNSDSSQLTAFDRYNSDKGNNRDRTLEDFDLGLVSLAHLWKSKASGEIPAVFQQKLQEERLRRQHCEQTIQDLQNRILEFEEKMAVAIQVDEAKDSAILRLHESWEKIVGKFQILQKDHEDLKREFELLTKKKSEICQSTIEKISNYEKEASKALDLAHSSQEKLAMMEKQYNEVRNELRIAELNSEEFQNKYIAEMEKNRQYPEIIAQKELELNEIKHLLSQARNEIAQSKSTIDQCQMDVATMKSENDDLHSKVLEEKDLVKKLIEQKDKLLEEINAHKNIAKGLQDELLKTREQLESNKIELKNFYQGQVELLVQNKLKEFQKQLDEAEKALKEELTKKEMSIAKMAASHIQQISEKHSLEVQLLEEKHREERRLCQIQLSQLQNALEESKQKLRRQRDRHAHIEKQLHKFMESLRQDHVNTVDEINSFRSKSFNNLEEILTFNTMDDHGVMGPKNNNNKDESSDKNSQLTYRVSDSQTPLSSRNVKRKDTSIQETIEMLLDRKHQCDDDQQAGERFLKDTKAKPPWK